MAALGGNFASALANGTERSQLRDRVGSIAILNLLPLYIGPGVNFIARIFAVRTEPYTTVHRGLGLLAVLAVLIHSLLALSVGRISFENQRDTAGLIAAVILVAIPTLNIAILRRSKYEIVLNLHRCLSIAAIIAIWLHLPPTPAFEAPRGYLLLITATYTILKFVGAIAMLVQGAGRAEIQQIAGLLEVRIQLSRPLAFRAGQYVNICIPALKTTHASFLQFHPFQVAWGYRDESQHNVLVLLIEARGGFTHDLLSATKTKKKHFVIVDGPYGSFPKVDQFGTVLFFATGIGIAGQLMFMKELIMLVGNSDAKAQRFALFWDIEAEVHRFWVRDWMDELLALDTEFVLDMQLFIRGQFFRKNAEGSALPLGGHNRIKLHYSPIDVQRILMEELGTRRGRTLISTCVSGETFRKITETIDQELDDGLDENKDVCLNQLGFHPYIDSESTSQDMA